MKAVQVMLDEALLARLDAQEAARGGGRSALIRQAVEAWLDQAREREIEAQYARAYGKGGGLGKDWEGWEEQGEWPSK
jgi:metal-responsive CopG/Arc/MetJ family transcriptional regulator